MAACTTDQEDAPCGTCKLMCISTDQALECDFCNSWHHAKCLKASNQLYKLLIKDRNWTKWLKVMCTTCSNKGTTKPNAPSHPNDRITTLQNECINNSHQATKSDLSNAFNLLSEMIGELRGELRQEHVVNQMLETTSPPQPNPKGDKLKPQITHQAITYATIAGLAPKKTTDYHQNARPTHHNPKQMKTHPRRPVGVGTRTTDPSNGFTSVGNFEDLFLSNCSPEAKPEDISNYVSTRGISTISVRPQHKNAEPNAPGQPLYSSFVIRIPAVELENALKAENWPLGTACSRYRNIQRRVPASTSWGVSTDHDAVALVKQAERAYKFQIGRCTLNTTETQLTDHLKKLDIKCTNVETETYLPYGHKSFTIEVEAKSVTKILNPDSWPTGITFKFLKPRGGTFGGTINSEAGTSRQTTESNQDQISKETQLEMTEQHETTN